MEDVMAPFPKCVLENALNPGFQSLEITYFPCTISKFKKMEKKTTQFSLFFFFGTDLHIWDICHKTLCLEHLACSSWQLWEPQGAAQNKIFPFLSCVKMQHHEPLLLLCSSIWRRREGENWFCNDGQAQHKGGAGTYIRTREEIIFQLMVFIG